MASVISLVVSWGLLALQPTYCIFNTFIFKRQINNDDDDDIDDDTCCLGQDNSVALYSQSKMEWHFCCPCLNTHVPIKQTACTQLFWNWGHWKVQGLHPCITSCSNCQPKDMSVNTKIIEQFIWGDAHPSLATFIFFLGGHLNVSAIDIAS